MNVVAACLATAPLQLVSQFINGLRETLDVIGQVLNGDSQFSHVGGG
ncbi:MAG: hypothetical protein IID44_03750 [Planctomycetes bacterium]|nr:hypothetical protein [Planctomycetota bacterium]